MRTKTLLFILAIFIPLACLSALDQKSSSKSSSGHSGGRHHATGTVSKVREGRVVVRVGDGSRSYSIDSTTVVTYGYQKSEASSLKEGDEIVITAIDDKAIEVNGTKHIKAIVKSIDIRTEILTVGIDHGLKQFPFNVFNIFKMDGKPASVLDMKVGDSVFMNVNMGFSKANPQKKQAVTKQ